MEHSLIQRLFPAWSLKRELARLQLAQMQRRYNAATPNQYRKIPTDQRSPDGVLRDSLEKLRRTARHMDENNDLAIGVLDELVNNIVGEGITAAPAVRREDGSLHVEMNDQIRAIQQEWQKRPETTKTLPMSEMQRLTCRAWLRDGEVLIKHIKNAPRFRYPSAVPYAVELLEADYLPINYDSQVPRIVQGIEVDGWGAPLAYWLYKDHPGNDRSYFLPQPKDLKRFDAENLIHLKYTRRIRQARGVTVLHGVIERLYDVFDYEQSEQIAARVAANFSAYIKRSTDFAGEVDSAGGRIMEMQAGMIFDTLLPGEDVGVIDSKRPNTALENFRAAMLRAVAAGTGAKYSAISRDYNGTYSSQRQEMVEGRIGYRKLMRYFVDMFCEPVHGAFIEMAMLSGALKVLPDTDIATLTQADYRGPVAPWIDPQKETDSQVKQIQAGLKSRAMVIREMGNDPDQVAREIEQEEPISMESNDNAQTDNESREGRDQKSDGESPDPNEADQGSQAVA